MNRPPACMYLLYIVIDQYYLLCPSRLPDSRTQKPSRLPDRSGVSIRRVYPTENPAIHSPFVANSQAARTGR